MKPFLRVSSSRVLHNAIANGSLVFFDCIPLVDAAPPPPPSKVLDELIFDDRKRLVQVSDQHDYSDAALSELASQAMTARHNAFVLGGEEKEVSRRLLEMLRSKDALRRVFSVPSELARAYFRRVPVLRAERFELPHEILPGLFLGCYASAARSAELLKALGITHVVNATGGFVNQFVGTFNYLDVDVQDSEEANIEEHFERVIEFVNEARREGGSVLIHCAAGVSRSTSLVLAYLMREEKLSFPVAATLVKSARLIVHPNPSFVEQLLRFEGANRKGCTIREFYLEPSQLREGHGGHVCSNNLVWRSGQVLGVENDEKEPKWFSKYI